MSKKSIDKSKKIAGKVGGDDRNLVLVDDDFQDADFEDKVWLFWKRHGKKTIATAVVVFFAILGAIIYTQGKKIHEANLQEEYAAATTPEARRAFAEAHRSDPMSGTAFYGLANELLKDGKFEEAAKDYAAAAEVFGALSDDAFVLARDNAKIGEAISLSKAGKAAEAKELFKALAGTLKTESVVRGQAMYNLAVLALAEDDIAGARAWLDEMDRSLPAQSFWITEKRGLIAMEPRLVAEPEVAPATNPDSATESDFTTNNACSEP